MNIQCPLCGKLHQQYPSQIGRKFCSMDCAIEYRHRQHTTEVMCASCGTPFRAANSNIKRGKGKFCSPECANECYHLQNSTELICSFCGIPFRLKNTVLRRQSRRGGIFCSKVCMDKSRERQKEHTCKKCGKVFTAQQSSQNKNLFCSRDCYIKDGGKRTSIEIFVENVLTKMGIQFQTQKSIKNSDLWTYVDFFFEPNICLYVDGDYWHSLPENAKRDIYNNQMLPKHNFVVYRIPEKDIKLGESKIMPVLESIRAASKQACII